MTIAGGRVRLLLVEDEALYRDLLEVALGRDASLAIVGAFADPREALAVGPDLQPDVALLDVEFGDALNGVQLGLMLRRRLPRMGIVLLSNHSEPMFATALGVQGLAGWSYLLKKSLQNVATLRRAIHGAAHEQVVLDPAVVSALRPGNRGPLAALTARQYQILGLIAQGLGNAAIAATLGLAEKSVENQINLLYQQCGIEGRGVGMHPRVQATLLYLRESRADIDRGA